MKKIFLILSFIVMTLSAQAIKKYIVHDEVEFMKALGSNRVIVVDENTRLDLSIVLDNKATCKELGIGWFDCGIELSGPEHKIISQSNYDGRELLLRYLENLSIEGRTGAEIVVDARYAEVLIFQWCKNVSLRNITLGHLIEGSCDGGVLELRNCENITIDHCDLFGCGIYGIAAFESKNIECKSSIIRDCSEGIIEIRDNCESVHFEQCDFYRNKSWSTLCLSGAEGTEFRECRFWQNEGDLFRLGEESLVVDCEIHHTGAILGEESEDPKMMRTSIDDSAEDISPRNNIGPK